MSHTAASGFRALVTARGLIWLVCLAARAGAAQAQWKEVVLHSFDGTDGQGPNAGVIRDSAGNLYGTAYNGGASGYGVAYKFDASRGLTVLHSFTDGADGANPAGPVIRDSEGNLYGTTANGGKFSYGVVYKLDTSGSETVLHSFRAGGGRGQPGRWSDPRFGGEPLRHCV